MNLNGKIRWIAGLLGLALLWTAAGCGSASSTPGNGELIDPPQAGGAEETTPGQVAASAKATVYPVKIKDATGKEFTFAKAPERIASVSPSETEALFALGLGDRIVGVSDYCDYPAEALTKPKLGSIVKPNEESLIAAHADIVLSGVSLKMPAVEQLRSLNVNVFKVEPKTMDDVINNILLFGQLFDKQEQAEQLAASMKAKRQQVAGAVKDLKPEQRKKVFIEFSPGWTVGKGEFIDELIALAGGINIAADQPGYMEINAEKVIADNPQVILYPDNLLDDKSKKSLDQVIRERSGWDQIEAVKSNRLVGLDKNLMSRPGPRMADSLVIIAKAVYPELVK